MHSGTYTNSLQNLGNITFSGNSSLNERVSIFSGKLNAIYESYENNRDIHTYLPDLGIYQADKTYQEVRNEHHRIVSNILEAYYIETLPEVARKISSPRNKITPDDKAALRTYVLLGDDDHYKHIAEKKNRVS